MTSATKNIRFKVAGFLMYSSQVIQKDDGTPIRHSSRIHEKRHRPTFRLPSRDEIWKDIPSTESIPNLKSLTPRKSVNNFTKVWVMLDVNYMYLNCSSFWFISSVLLHKVLHCGLFSLKYSFTFFNLNSELYLNSLKKKFFFKQSRQWLFCFVF